MISANEHFEIVGELYERRFHKLRPGKSVSPVAGYDSNDDDNVKQFQRWVVSAQAWEDAIEHIARLQKEAELERVIVEQSARIGKVVEENHKLREQADNADILAEAHLEHISTLQAKKDILEIGLRHLVADTEVIVRRIKDIEGVYPWEP